MSMCEKCGKISGWLLLLVGIALLLVDWNVWTFWNIKWSTAAFIILGIGLIGCSGCADCRACCGTGKSKKKKK